MSFDPRRLVPRACARVLACLGLAAVVPAAFAAEAYPVKPIRIVHGYASGSSMDTNARTVGAKFTEMFGQQVVVDSRPGATGMIANELVARSAPDGYTLLAAPGSAVAATPHLQKAPIDTLRDLVPVAPIGEFSHLMVAHPNVPAKTARDVIALAKARPGVLTYGSNGVGSAYHLAGALMCAMAGIDMIHVPYRGGGATAISDILGGRVDLLFNSPVFLLPHVRSGKLRAIGVTGVRRMTGEPGIPTIAESGLPGYEMAGWQGLLAPAGTPRDVVERLNAAMARILAAPDVKERWTAQGMEAVARTTAEFSARVRSDYESYGKLIRRIGAKID